jgi:DNA-binding XRE family transcriptional regulator
MTSLRQLRLVAGLRQVDVAERSDLSRETVRLLEAGEQRPHLATARRIARTLGVRVEAVFPELLDPAGDDQEAPGG